MLVLCRKSNQSIWIGRFIQLTIKKIEGNRVSIAIEAPQFLRIQRDEKDCSEINLVSITKELLLSIASQSGVDADAITDEVMDISNQFASIVKGVAA